MSVIRFTGFKINNIKEDQIKPSSDGYYEMIVGGLNIHNSSGQFYTLDGVKDLFEGSSTLKRRIENGTLKGEVGHPIKEPGMTSDKFLERWLELRDTNICVHYSDIWLDTSKVKEANGMGAIAVIARLKPSGVHATALKDALDNNLENVAFSVRGFTEDRQIGSQKVRTLKTIITYDFVNEPGIKIANKFTTANNGIGNLSGEALSATQTFDRILTENDLKCIERRLNDNCNGLSSESIFSGLNDDLKQIVRKTDKPIWTKW